MEKTELKMVTIEVPIGSYIVPPSCFETKECWEEVLAYCELHRGEPKLINLLESEFGIIRKEITSEAAQEDQPS